jgi:putative membrane protein
MLYRGAEYTRSDMRYEPELEGFWRSVITIKGSVLRVVIVRALYFGALALGVYVIGLIFNVHLGISVAPYELGGALLGMLLVLRTNAGYDRWWEARKLWGSIVNQSRNLVVTVLANAPDDAAWRDETVRWIAAFSHVAQYSLRGERTIPRLDLLLGREEAARIAAADHMPSYVTLRIAKLLRDGRDRLGLDSFVYLIADQQRTALIDHIGGCERILKTPLPRVYSVEIHRFIMLFLITLPFALLDKLHYAWLNPIATVMVAYPLLALNQIGIDLQNPFDRRMLGHLPLEGICDIIERNSLSLLSTKEPAKQTDGTSQPSAPLSAS